MTKSLAAEGARYGVRANSISPGFVSTPATDKAVDAEGKAWQVGNARIQRPGTGEDIAYMPLYLASDESSRVTGQNYSVAGGATAGWRHDSEPARPRVKASGITSEETEAEGPEKRTNSARGPEFSSSILPSSARFACNRTSLLKAVSNSMESRCHFCSG